MLWNLDPAWLMMAVATVAVLSYFFGAALHWLRREDGFGAFGNAIIISGSFFLSILVANHQGYNLRDLHLAVIVGLCGAFVVLASLTLLRALIARI
jgi:fluoride ion exporter CrcB/FEX